MSLSWAHFGHNPWFPTGHLKRRTLLWLVLIRITVDFISPSMPGSFVFDAAKVVESVAYQSC